MTLGIENLTVTTSGGKVLLDNCSWSVQTGERLGVIGESGSGKSLTAQAILGLLPSGMTATGSVQLNGVELLGAKEKELRKVRGAKIAMIFQEPLTALDPLMKVGRQITGPLQLHRGLSKSAAKTRVVELCNKVALRDTERILNSYPWQLSGGQRQRVSIAMALACSPDVLIADEPTTALDVTVQAEILALLNELIEQTGTTLVFVSHDLPVVASVAQGLVVMQHGKVIEATTVSRALTGPNEPYTQHLLDSARKVTALPAGTVTGMAPGTPQSSKLAQRLEEEN